jgi:hypothetical protein
MTILMFLVMAAAGSLAWVLAQRRPEHRPIALLLSALLATDAAQWAIEVGALAPLRARFGVEVQWTGWARVAVHVAEALWLIWPAAVVAASLMVFAGRKPWPALVGWTAFVAGIVIGYPSLRHGNLVPVLVAALVLSLVISVGLFVGWYRRPAPATSAHFSMTMILAIEMTSLFAAWRHVQVIEHWDLSQVLGLVLFGALIVFQGRCLWTTQSTRSTQSSP